MMTAIANSTKEVVVAKGANGRDEFSCPDCQQPVYPRHRAKWTDHFVHKPNSTCKTKLVASLESDEHKLGKQLIVDWLKENRDSSVEIVTEKTIKTIDGRCRKIDVAVIKDGKVIEAHECQLSPICIGTEKEGLLDRTLDYHRLGISVTWWMGNKADTYSIETWIWDFTEYEDHRKLGEIKHGRFSLSGYHIGYPNFRLQALIESSEEVAMGDEGLTEQERQDEIAVISSGVATFLSSIRAALPLNKQEELDKKASDYLDCQKIDDYTREELQILLLELMIEAYTQYCFELNAEVVCKGVNKEDTVDAVLNEESICIAMQKWQDIVKKTSFDLVVKGAPSCFEYFTDWWINKNQTILTPSMIECIEASRQLISQKVINDVKLPATSIVDLFFKYSNPQTAKALIKEAIANALDQNPAEATALCAAWEQIQPTLEKDIKPAPLWVKQVTEENPPLSVNGNGRY